MTDREILEGLKKRDEEALLNLHNTYRSYCSSIICRFLEDKNQQEECLSDVWLALWENAEPILDLRAYLAKTARNTALHYLRKNSAQKRSAPLLLLDELSQCIPDPMGSMAIEGRALRELLERFLRSLSKTERCLFLRRYWYGYSLSELAEELGWQEAKVNSMLYRLRKKLKKALEKEGFFP